MAALGCYVLWGILPLYWHLMAVPPHPLVGRVYADRHSCYKALANLEKGLP